MENNSENTFLLLTKLCEKFCRSQNHLIFSPVEIKKIRSKCYEILLLKKSLKNSIVEDLENNADPYCHLLAWEFQLRTEYDLPQYAENLRKCCDKLQELNAFSNDNVSNVLLFLLQLRKVPRQENQIMQTNISNQDFGMPVVGKTSFACFDDSKFQLPLECPKLQFESDRFKLHVKKKNKGIDIDSIPDVLSNVQRHPVNGQKRNLKSEAKPKEGDGHVSTVDSLNLGNIWEIASHGIPNKRFNWESFGCFTAAKEPPFLCESGSESTIWIDDLTRSFEGLISDNFTRQNRIVISHRQLIKDIKYLLVGMESKTFVYKNGELSILSGTCVEGLRPTAVETYCNDFICAGSCYKGLTNLCTLNPFTQTYVHNGYIFLELCQSIKRYLSFYRVAALSISDATPLLSFHEQTKQLRTHITVLASVCKVGPFSEIGEIPQGVALLNYLYQKVMAIANRDVIAVLYSILYPCCQVYFTRYLKRWIMEGVIQDPYNEFFIRVNSKYQKLKARPYWTRSFMLYEDIVPDFLVDLKDDILLCGKSMNFLKFCIPNSPLYNYMVDKQPNIVSCCIMADQLSGLELNNHSYYLDMVSHSGPRISLSQIISNMRIEDDAVLSAIAKKRAVTLEKIDLEQKKEMEAQLARKQKKMMELQEQIREANKRRRMEHIQSLEDKLQVLQQEIRLQELQNKIIQEESTNLVAYYNKLFEAAESRRKHFERQSAAMKEAKLDDKKVHWIDFGAERSAALGEQDEDLQEEAGSDGKSYSGSESCTTFVSVSENSLDNNSEFGSAGTGQSVVNENDQNGNVEKPKESNLYWNTMQTFQDARRNKERINAAHGFTYADLEKVETIAEKNAPLTEAQRNKMRCMAAEYGSRLNEYQCAMDVKKNCKEPAESRKKTRPHTAPTNNNRHSPSPKSKSPEPSGSPSPVVSRKASPEKPPALTDAQRNKLRIMQAEFGSDYMDGAKEVHQKDRNHRRDHPEEKNNRLKEKNQKRFEVSPEKESPNRNEINANKPADKFAGLTEAQKNKLKVMAAEYGQDIDAFLAKTNNNLYNRSVTEEVISDGFDNANYVNQNVDDDSNSNVTRPKRHTNLSLDFSKLNKRGVKSPKFELDRVSPMSVDSPRSPGQMSSSIDSYLTATAAASADIGDGFNFELDGEEKGKVYNLGAAIGNISLSKTVTVKDASLISPNCLKLCLQQSVAIPLVTQIKLVNNELLKYFIQNLDYLNQLQLLRNYFFLLDGEFAHNITEELFLKLYDADCPVDFVNNQTLREIMFKALDYSSKRQTPATLSFKINSLPVNFNLGDPNVFDCISMTYKPAWPLNVLLPPETIGKYDEVFRFLLKLHRISWVLQNMFQNLKMLMKEGSGVLTMSTHYRRLHQCRHVMTHFVQTLQSYLIGEVVQSSWATFERNLETVVSFDQLYVYHTVYIKNILFMCLLNRKSAPLKEILMKIFSIILKFYDYLRSRPWIVENEIYVHPNFKKLQGIYTNFEEMTQYLFKVGQKVAQSGYQPHLMQLLDMLDVNNFYTNRSFSDLLAAPN